MKKSIIAACFLCGFGQLAFAQTYKIKIPNSADQRVEIELPATGVLIEGYSGDEVIIKGPDNLKPIPDRAKGLKPIYYGSTDNTGIGLSAEKKGNTLVIQKAVRQEAAYTIKVPSKVSVKYQQLEFNGGDDVVLKGLEGDVEIKTNQVNIKAGKISGSFVANSISGDIEVQLGQASASKTVAVSTISGDIDMTMPAGIKSSLGMKAIQGEIFTDFDIQRVGGERSGSGLPRVGGGNSLEGTINGGGMAVNLSVISGNIYLRKAR